MTRSFLRILVKGQTVHILGDDPVLLSKLGVPVFAERFMDVRPVVQDDKLVWAVLQNGTLLQTFPTRAEAIEFERELIRRYHGE